MVGHTCHHGLDFDTGAGFGSEESGCSNGSRSDEEVSVVVAGDIAACQRMHPMFDMEEVKKGRREKSRVEQSRERW